MIGKKRLVRNLRRRGSKKSSKELVSCTGKIRHTSYQRALDANTHKAGLVKPYKCQFCPYYHVGRKKIE